MTAVVPCRNEEGFIAQCLDAIVANDYPKDRLEVFVIDGLSHDKTKEIALGYVSRYPFVRVFDNPKKILAAAWNMGIKNGKGSVIMSLNAHAIISRDYISKCVYYLHEYQADYVGGVINSKPRAGGLINEAVTLALSHKFGVGNSYFRIGIDRPMWADTAAFGGYRREVFEKVGFFNEELARSQDMEFHLRLKKAGIKILLAPDMVSLYYIRSGLKDLWRDNFVNGFWTLYPLAYASIAVSWRHLVPLCFVVGLIGSLLLSIIWPLFAYFALIILCSYSILNLYFSFCIFVQRKNFRYFCIMPWVFFILHFQYGLGSCCGGIKASLSKRFWQHLIQSRESQ